MRMFKSLATAAALAASLSMGQAAHAGFNYTSDPTPLTDTFGSTSKVNFSAGSGLSLAGSQDINLAGVGLTSTAPATATDTGSIPLTLDINITQTTPGNTGTGLLKVVGTLVFTRSDTDGQDSSFTLDAGASILSTNIGGVVYELPGVVYASPTVNATPGAISTHISIVPEPSSLALLGLGALGLVGLARRRRADD